jgi:hypothetical protein
LACEAEYSSIFKFISSLPSTQIDLEVLVLAMIYIMQFLSPLSIL